MSTYRRGMRRLFCTSGILFLVASYAACDLLDVHPSRSRGGAANVTVMTRNLYLGADFNMITGAQSPDEIPGRVTQFFMNVQATNYPDRARALADEIAETRPHLIGLQEVALYRVQSVSDYLDGITEPNATDVVLDFLALLQSELRARELPYRVVNESVNVDEELPGAVSATEFFDLRLTLRNVILARANVRQTDSHAGIYDASLEIPVGGRLVSFTRSYGWIDAAVAGVPFRFVNTHLETHAAAAAQEAQSGELIELLEDFDGPVILVGDFNSAADGTTTASYSTLTSRFTDGFASANPGEAGYTCCQSADLRNPVSTLDRRLDLILYRGDVEVASAQRIGEAPQDRTQSGLWPSDHAGVTAELELGR